MATTQPTGKTAPLIGMFDVILDKLELFYQKINRLGLQIYEVDGFQYGYNSKEDCLIYEKWVDGYWRFSVAVDIDILEFYQDKELSFQNSMNEQFSEAYCGHVIKRLAKQEQKTSIYRGCKTFGAE